MKKCKVLEYFTLKKFNKLENIVRADENNNTKNGELFFGDTFDCTDEMAEYLTGNNESKLVVVEIIENEKKAKVEEPIEEEIEDEEIIDDIVEEPTENTNKNKKHGKK